MPQLIVRAIPSSLIRIISFSKSLGEPVKFVDIFVILVASAVIVTTSQLFVLIDGVADDVIVVTRGLIRLFCSISTLLRTTSVCVPVTVFGALIVKVDDGSMLSNEKTIFFVLSLAFCKVNESSLNVLFVNVCTPLSVTSPLPVPAPIAVRAAAASAAVKTERPTDVESDICEAV